MRAPTPLYADAEQSALWTDDERGSRRRAADEEWRQRDRPPILPTARAALPLRRHAQFDTYYNRKLFVVPSQGGAARC